jgi:hypothetical protein
LSAPIHALEEPKAQNEKLGIDEFDKFPLPVPPLDDDPFTSLSVVDLTAMEANDDAEGGSGSEYDEDEEVDGDDEDYDGDSLLLAHAFSLFGALMPKGEKSLSSHLSLYLDLAYKTLIMLCRSCGHGFLNPLWCACKNLIIFLWLL